MQVLLDDIPCQVEATTVGEAIDAAAVLVEVRGRLIVEVTVDGARWTEAELCSPDRCSAVAEIVRLTSADPTELVRRTFADADEALADAGELQRQAAELLQSDKRTVSMDKLHEAVSLWLSVQEAIVKGSTLMGLNLDEVVGQRPIRESINSLHERLESIHAALRDRDEIGLADTLLYEFPEVVEEWRAVLEALQRRLSENQE